MAAGPRKSNMLKASIPMSAATLTTSRLVEVPMVVAMPPRIIILFAEPIIRIIFGNEYLPATNALRILAIAVLIVRFTFWINPALLAMARPGLRTVLEVIATSAYLILMFALVPPYSYIGAAYAFLGYAVLRSGLAFKFFRDALCYESRKL